jgi:hypothetical protein
MAADRSHSSDPAVTERPSAAARLIIKVGPDPPGEREAGSAPPSGTRPARQAWESPDEADGPRARSQGNRGIN